jgi:uncharacterized protein (DUF305 family)
MNYFLLVAAVAALTFSLTACNGNLVSRRESHHTNSPMNDDHHYHAASGTSDMQRIMDKMMADMHSAKPSGNPDRDFAAMMISHHQGAVEMAEAELATGTDAQMRKLAEDIVAVQRAEVSEMQGILASLPEGDPEAGPAAYDALMGSMSGIMEPGPGPSGNPDKDFVQAMIPHHECAVEMAKVEVQYGRNEKLKKMAEKMIADQTREIVGMKAWLAAHP